MEKANLGFRIYKIWDILKRFTKAWAKIITRKKYQKLIGIELLY